MIRTSLYRLALLSLCFACVTQSDALAKRDKINGVDKYIHVVSAQPGDNARGTSPRSIFIKFSRAIKDKNASITVLNEYGSSVTMNTAQVRGKDMSLALPYPLSAGRYLVRWQAQCDCEDMNVLRDSFSFVVE